MAQLGEVLTPTTRATNGAMRVEQDFPEHRTVPAWSDLEVCNGLTPSVVLWAEVPNRCQGGFLRHASVTTEQTVQM